MKPFLGERYQTVLQKIRTVQKNREVPRPIVLIAVCKAHSVDDIEVLYRMGHRDFGENYAQELAEKARDLEARGLQGIRWHFIGHLQVNKVKTVLPYLFSIHTIDSERLAKKISEKAVELSKVLPVFVQVNIDRETSKSGLLPEQVSEFVQAAALFKGLSLQGLMCIPAYSGNMKESFSSLRQLGKKCEPLTQGMLSMGMSDDYEMAIVEGATHIRVGSAIFGRRRKSPEIMGTQ